MSVTCLMDLLKLSDKYFAQINCITKLKWAVDDLHAVFQINPVVWLRDK